MRYDSHGTAHVTEQELCELLYRDPELRLDLFHVDDPDVFNRAVRDLVIDIPELTEYEPSNESLADFDARLQRQWFMPQEYMNMDIAHWVLERCNGEAELQRCGEELLLFQDRDAFDLLRYLKYLVDTLRARGVVWGVGRGSSVASFVLYKIGVHRINSLEYDLDPREFLK